MTPGGQITWSVLRGLCATNYTKLVVAGCFACYVRFDSTALETNTHAHTHTHAHIWRMRVVSFPFPFPIKVLGSRPSLGKLTAPEMTAS